MAATYCTVDMVANTLGFPAGYFDANSTPTNAVVTRFIEESQDRIDNSTGHAWRSVTITKEYVRPSSIYRYGTGIRFDLIHRKVKDFSEAQGDKIEIWDGNSWVDWVSTKTEGRGEAWWADYENGVIFIRDTTRIYPHGIRVTYRYGEEVVPGGIQQACTRMAAIAVLNSPEFSAILFTDNGQTDQSHTEKIRYWQQEIDKVLSYNREFQ